jgi:hypothetical protein
LVVVNAGAVSRFADAAAAQLLARTPYVTSVLGAEPRPAALPGVEARR